MFERVISRPRHRNGTHALNDGDTQRAPERNGHKVINMKKVWNIHWVVCMIIWCTAALCYVVGVAVDRHLIDDAVYVAAILLLLFFSLLFHPIRMDFDRKAITIHFMFGFYETMDWKSIWKIERQAMPEDIRYYKIFCDGFVKSAFFTSPKIPYNRKVQKLLREYWNSNFQK